jgi:hypothetical protein
MFKKLRGTHPLQRIRGVTETPLAAFSGMQVRVNKSFNH